MNKKIYETHTHEFGPEYDINSKILILGSFPSVKSRENQFYYGHPANRFWKVLAAVFNENVPETIEEKKIFLHKKNIALWDVIAQCDIVGSSDSSIKNVIPNDIKKIINETHIKRIYTNGKKAESLYNKYILPQTGLESKVLASTSPANAACSLDKLIEIWKIIR